MKLTVPQKKALERIGQHTVLAGPESGCFHLGNGESIHAGVVKRLLEKGAIISNNDGLLDGFTQTYSVAEC